MRFLKNDQIYDFNLTPIYMYFMGEKAVSFEFFLLLLFPFICAWQKEANNINFIGATI